MQEANSFLLASFHQASGTSWEDEQLDRIHNLASKYDVNIIYYKLQTIPFDLSIFNKIENIFTKFIPNAYIIRPSYGSQILIDLRRYRIKIDKIITLKINDDNFWNIIEDIKNTILKNYPRVIKDDCAWKEILTNEQYSVCREKGTEKAFSGKYYKSKEEGIYHCTCCNNSLFSSNDKFDSNTGWPSFSFAVRNSTNIKKDLSHNMTRQEVLCAVCDAHLGHLFADTRSNSGQRYCINSVALVLK